MSNLGQQGKGNGARTTLMVTYHLDKVGWLPSLDQMCKARQALSCRLSNSAALTLWGATVIDWLSLLDFSWMVCPMRFFFLGGVVNLESN